MLFDTFGTQCTSQIIFDWIWAQLGLSWQKIKQNFRKQTKYSKKVSKMYEYLHTSCFPNLISFSENWFWHKKLTLRIKFCSSLIQLTQATTTWIKKLAKIYIWLQNGNLFLPHMAKSKLDLCALYIHLRTIFYFPSFDINKKYDDK